MVPLSSSLPLVLANQIVTVEARSAGISTVARFRQCGYVKLPLQCLVALLVEYIYPAFFGVNSGKPSNGCHAIPIDSNFRTHK